MKRFRLFGILIAVVTCLAPPAFAQPTTSGKVARLYADPSDFVIELDTRGRCGSAFFHVQRANTNFKELTAVALTAFATGKTMTLFVASCITDRNIVSHGAVNR
jgi:hypothetical protein